MDILEIINVLNALLTRNFQRDQFEVADMLPARNLEQPVVGRPADGQVVELAPMLDEYYTNMDWDERGVPTHQRFRELHLINGGIENL